MTNEEKTVSIQADQGTESFGKNAYVAAVEGQFDKHGFRSSLVVVIALMALIMVVMWITSKPPRDQKSGQALPSPAMSRDDPVLGPKLLTERDLTNVIRPRLPDRSVLGKIRVFSLRSIFEIPIGAEVKATLESGATDGIVKAKITDPLLVDGEPILPSGAVLFGKGKSGEERLSVEFKKVILPSGESFPIRAQAFDASDRILGLKGAIVGTKTKKIASAMAFGFLGGMADGLQETGGASILYGRRPTMRDAALAGASKAALDQSQMYLEDLKRSPNVIHVKSGEPIVVIFDEPKKQKEDFNESR
jgi:hypothetical protein